MHLFINGFYVRGNMIKYCIGLLKFVILIGQISQMIYAQNNDYINILDVAPNIYLDGYGFDLNHVRKNIKFVNYVNQRQEADVYILVTRNRTGSDGREYTLTFIGRDDFAGTNDTLKFNTLSTETQDIIRDRFTKTLTNGLFPFMIKTPLADLFDVKFKMNKEIKNVEDNWDNWVFKTRLRGNFSGEESKDSYYLSGNINANRITEDWKLRFNAGINYDEENYNYPGEDSYSASSRRWSASGFAVKSISDHWSLGGVVYSSSSTYSNIELSYGLAPAIEYNIYPYSESTYREIKINYEVRFVNQFYNEITIYDKLEEFLIRQSIGITTEIIQPWGELEATIKYSSHLNDFSKRRLRFWGDISVNIFKGLSLEWGVGYSMIHDQLSLPARDLDLDEILLRRNELATDYSYWMRSGISYTFGSIYNNIVNSRF